MTPDEEDRILQQAKEIQKKIWAEAETKWAQTPLKERKRPWPRCSDVKCNRTLVCQESAENYCQGYDF